MVFWQATTVAIVGIVAGVPLGIAAGRVIWRVFAIRPGVVAVPVVPAGSSWRWRPACCRRHRYRHRPRDERGEVPARALLRTE